MEEVWIRDAYIKLGQAMKLGGLSGSGVDAKMVIQDGLVRVNGDVCTMRGKKIYDGDIISFGGEEICIRMKSS